MSSRAQLLEAVTVGDLVFGLREGGRPDLLLVHSASSASFLARNIFNRATFTFARDGEGRRLEDGSACTIVSTARLPPDKYNVAIGLDRRMGSSPEYPDTRMTEDEIQLALTHEQFFEARLLPGTEAFVRQAQKLRAVTSMLLADWDPVSARENPPSLGEYDDDVSALVDVLNKQPTIDFVASFLTGMASRRGRTSEVAARSKAAAVGLLRLAQGWT